MERAACTERAPREAQWPPTHGLRCAHDDTASTRSAKAQGFKAPGPKLIQRVATTIEQADDAPAGERRYQFDYAEVLADTPELIDRTDGPMTDPGTETSYALAEVLNKAYAYVSEDSDGRG